MDFYQVSHPENSTKNPDSKENHYEQENRDQTKITVSQQRLLRRLLESALTQSSSSSNTSNDARRKRRRGIQASQPAACPRPVAAKGGQAGVMSLSDPGSRHTAVSPPGQPRGT